mgnify:CR=1 FL=1
MRTNINSVINRLKSELDTHSAQWTTFLSDNRNLLDAQKVTKIWQETDFKWFSSRYADKEYFIRLDGDSYGLILEYKNIRNITITIGSIPQSLVCMGKPITREIFEVQMKQALARVVNIHEHDMETQKSLLNPLFIHQ